MPLRDADQSSPRRRQPTQCHTLLADWAWSSDLEGEAEARQVFARMVVGIGELRDFEVLRPRFLALVDRRIKVDEMPARLNGPLEEDFDVTLAIKRESIADVIVVIDDRVDVGGFRPADALQMDLECGTRRASADVERERVRGDPMHCGLLLPAV